MAGCAGKAETGRTQANQGVALHIIRSLSAVYHHAAGRYTLARDEMQGRLAALDDMHRTLCGDDMPSLRLG